MPIFLPMNCQPALLASLIAMLLGFSAFAQTAQPPAGDTPEFGNRIAQAATLARTGQFREAEAQYRALIPEAGQIFGAEEPNTLNLKMALARTLCVMGQYQEAEDKSRDLIRVLVRTLGRDHTATIFIWRNLAFSLAGQGKYDAADNVFTAIYQALTAAHKEDHPDMVRTRCAQGEVHCQKGEYITAEKELRAQLPVAERLLGPNHPETLAVYASLAACAKANGSLDEAIALMTHARDIAKKKLGDEHIDTKKYEAELKDLLTKKDQ